MTNAMKGTAGYANKLDYNRGRKAAKRLQTLKKKPAVCTVVKHATVNLRKELDEMSGRADTMRQRSNEHMRKAQRTAAQLKITSSELHDLKGRMGKTKQNECEIRRLQSKLKEVEQDLQHHRLWKAWVLAKVDAKTKLWLTRLGSCPPRQYRWEL